MNGGTPVSYSYPSGSSKLSSVGASSYTYDAMGNATAKGAQSYVYNAAAQMAEAKLSGVTVGTYTYNAYNQRTKKVAGGNTVHYVYGPGGTLLGEYDNSGNFIREYVYANGEPLTQIDAGSPESVLYLHTDHLLTARYATDAGGSTVWTWDSGAFGVEAPTGSATVNLRFPGQYYDGESGLHYNWHRYYDPATGRYITSDPLGLIAGLNTYGYAAQNPLSFIDRDGQWAWIPGVMAAIPAGIWLWNNWGDVVCLFSGNMHPRDFINKHGAGMAQTAAESAAAGLGGLGVSRYGGTAFSSVKNSRWFKKLFGETDQAAKTVSKNSDEAVEGTSTSASGLSGSDFEAWLKNKTGGQGSFKANAPGHPKPREFDGAYDDTFYEAKSGNAANLLSGSEAFKRFQSQIGEQEAIARALGKNFEVHVNGPVSDAVRQWLSERGIPLIEH